MDRSGERIIGKILGSDMVWFAYRTSAQTRWGWRTLEQRKNLPATLRVVDKSWRQLDEMGVRLFAGSSPLIPRKPRTPPYTGFIFALPDLPMLDIVEFAQTGVPLGASVDPYEAEFQAKIVEGLTRSFRPSDKADFRRKIIRGLSGAPRLWSRVQAGLTKIEKKCPFAITYATQLSLTGTFRGEPRVMDARAIAKMIRSINPEAEDCLRPGETLEQVMRSTGKFQLWWD